MKAEGMSTPEESLEALRQRAVTAAKALLEKGITNPDRMDLKDPEVKAANKLFFDWIKQGDILVHGDEDAELRFNLAKTMFYVDAGFTDEKYLNEILQFLFLDAHDAEKDDSPERAETRNLIAEAIKKVRGLLNKSE